MASEIARKRKLEDDSDSIEMNKGMPQINIDLTYRFHE